MNETPSLVLFLCTGNYYRSRFAEHYFNHLAAARRLPWRAESRGLQLCADLLDPIAGATLRQLEGHGVCLPATPRSPLACLEDDLQRADLVVAVKEAEHRPLLERSFAAWVGRVEFWHVHDIDFAHPEQALPELETHVEELVARLENTPRPANGDERRSA